jgi:lipid II:glycine glycyltransferase (peptidoglycan interpeptide bridge formation enzyme)
MTTIPARHFLQSSEWALFQKKIGKQVFERSGKGWSYVAIKENGDGSVGKRFTRLYCPYGPAYTSDTTLHLALTDLELLAHEQNVDYIRIEPNSMSANKHITLDPTYIKQSKSFQPNLTLLINLETEFDDVLHGMSKTNRYLWNKVEKNNLTFRISYEPKDLQDFLLMIAETESRTGTRLHSEQYFKDILSTLGPTKYAGIAYVCVDNQPLSGVLFVDDIEGATRYYMYAGSYDKARQYSANSPLVTFLLKDAKEKGLNQFDFFGIIDKSQTNHKWAGFSQFKRSFGGAEWQFNGMWEKPIKPLRYKIMHTARKVASR